MTAKGLGKGLGALISMFDEDMEELTQNTAAKPAPRKAENAIRIQGTPAEVQQQLSSMAGSTAPTRTLAPQGAWEIDINLIDNNSAQPRKNFSAEEMYELEQSIKTHGILQPILLNKVGTRYMIVAGERRWRAAKAVGLRTVPALVREYSSKQVAEVSLIENLIRSDLNEIETALGIKRLMDTHLLTQEQVSSVLGKSRSAIANSLRLLYLPQEVQSLLEQKQITMGHAKCLMSLTDKAQIISLARQCADGKISVRELETLTTNAKPWNKDLPKPKIQSLEVRNIARNLTELLASKVTIQGDETKGRIIIDYHTQQELDRIFGRIKK